MNNGEGIRVVLWLSGCPHKCPGCHNPQTWNHMSGNHFTGEVKEYMLELLGRDYIDGLTLSGGDPMDEHNKYEVIELAREVKERYPNKSIWMWTGYNIDEIPSNKLVNLIDCIIDGKYDKTLPTKKKWRGSDNQKRYVSKDGEYVFID